MHLYEEYLTEVKFKTQHILISDEKLNVLVYGSLRFDEIQHVGRLENT